MRKSRVVYLLVCAGCGGDEGSRRPEPVKPPIVAEVSVSPTSRTGWLVAAGPVLIAPVPGIPGEIMFVLPDVVDRDQSLAELDLDLLGKGEIELFGPKGLLGRTEIIPDSGVERDCGLWPTARTRQLGDSRWRIGLVADRARAVAADSLSTESPEGKSLLRLVSETAQDSKFSGIPFTLRTVYRMKSSDGTLLIGDAVRQINTEANVRIQHALVLATRKTPDSRYVLAYANANSGTESTAQALDFLAALSIDNEIQPVLVIATESEAGTRFAVLRSGGDGKWVMSWRSARSVCS